METENSGVLEAYILDPIPRPLGVIRWTVYCMAGRNIIELGRSSMPVSTALYLVDSNPHQGWVVTGMLVDQKEVLVKRDHFLKVLRSHV